ncbi:General substrate transporter [Niveomyces insectorum RCEF 264]|uniref:General substrate transporter n=1 Tax=Niveomyces insectorum RCEF 264 TaxID=1081102 RepID=A0A167P1M3_9HYPO|nr:General substrate transporter [Niveomyces insectorum RCEF 264]
MTFTYNLLRRMVRNDAMRDDPPEIYNWRIFGLAAGACFGGALFGVDSGIIGGVLSMDPFKAQYGLDKLSPSANANLSGNLVITMQAGAILGSLTGYPFGDIIGRRPSLLMYSIFAFIGGLLQTFAYGHLTCFYIGRFVEGIGLGGATMLGPMYVAENAPRAIRGFLVGFFQLLLVTASMCAYFCNYGSLLHLNGRAMYMVPLSIQSVPALFLFFSVLSCPESPRWLASKDNWEAVGRVLSRMRQLPVEHPYIQHELHELHTQLEEERRGAAQYGEGFWAAQKEMWLVASNRNRALLAIGIMTCQQWTGTNAINYYSPRIFGSLGLSSNTAGLFATGIYGVVRVVTCGLFIALVADSLGRRWSFVWTGIGCGATMYYIGFYSRFDPPKTGESISAAGYVALVCIYLFAAIFEFGWGPIAWVYINEIPTNRLRGYTVSMASATQWIWGLVVTKVGPIMLVNIPYGTYFVFGSFCLLWGVLAFWIPETKGLSLERIDEIFGAADLSAVGDFNEATVKKEVDASTAAHHD